MFETWIETSYTSLLAWSLKRFCPFSVPTYLLLQVMQNFTVKFRRFKLQCTRKCSSKEEKERSQVVPGPLTGPEFLCQNAVHTLPCIFSFLYCKMEGLDRYQKKRVDSLTAQRDKKWKQSLSPDTVSICKVNEGKTLLSNCSVTAHARSDRSKNIFPLENNILLESLVFLLQ